MRLQLLIDRMIDQASEIDPEGSYTILLGKTPAEDMDWTDDASVYRSCAIAQSRLVPNNVVVLAPSPENLRHGDLVEFHGGILNGDVTRHTTRNRRAP